MTTSTAASPTQVILRVEEATIHLLAAFDIGFEIRMSQIPVLFGTRTRDPVGYNFLNRSIGRETLPIRIAFDPTEIEVQGRSRKFQVYGTFFDVGALSLEFIGPLGDDIQDFPKLATELQNSREFIAAARRIGEEIYNQAKAAVVNPDFYPHPQTFTVFNVHRLNPRVPQQQIVERLGTLIAKTLRLSDEPIGSSEVARTLDPSITYSDEDVVFTSAQVAVIFDETSSEVIDIFELSNMQCLELRFIDARLDRTLQDLYEDTGKKNSIWNFPNLFENRSRRLNTIHLDSTIIVERVEQSFKFAVDSYLVRIHEVCVQKMFLRVLTRGIDRKLLAIRDIFTDQRDRAQSLRMEVLEWIIIVLIAIEALPWLFKSLAGLWVR